MKQAMVVVVSSLLFGGLGLLMAVVIHKSILAVTFGMWRPMSSLYLFIGLPVAGVIVGCGVGCIAVLVARGPD